ncbi:MAG: glycosyl hydrolase [Pirellulaceae bacterium]|nr:MAG: glycosyl hydrolase [Pirellulaceae bacterium]
MKLFYVKTVALIWILILTFLSSDLAWSQDVPNTLTDQERQAGWRLLFDGRTTSGWRAYRGKEVPTCWKVEDGVLLSRPEPGDTRGDIITVDQFDDFELRWQWRMTPGGNSGVVYRATEAYDFMWQSGPEYQILDNQRHLDGLNPLASAGACYAVFAPSRDATKPVGQWNDSRLVVSGKHVEHWLNGELLLQYEIDSDVWKAHVKTSKFYLTAYGQGTWGKAERGHIGLQDYGGAIGFRNIKLRPLHTSQ